MEKKLDPKILQAEIKGKIREFYPYFLGFYLLSLIVSLFFQDLVRLLLLAGFSRNDYFFHFAFCLDL